MTEQTITLKKLIAGEVSLKDTLDYVEAKVVEQGHPALNAYGGCVYITEAGDKCAVGHLLTEEDRSNLNQLTGNVYCIIHENQKYFDVVGKFDNPDGTTIITDYANDVRLNSIINILTLVQNAHDFTESRSDFVNRFKIDMDRIRNVCYEAIAAY